MVLLPTFAPGRHMDLFAPRPQVFDDLSLIQEREFMPRQTPTIPSWIREFSHPGYVNVYSLDGLRSEPKLFCTETLFGDWDGQTLLLAKDAAPAKVIMARVEAGELDPWRHGVRGRDPMGYQTNEQVEELAGYFTGSNLYGSALAHLLKEDERTSSSLADFTSGRLHNHLKRVLEFVVQDMSKLRAIVCLGNEAHGLVSSCPGGHSVASLPVGGCGECVLFERQVLVGRLYHPSRPQRGSWPARHLEWRAVADKVNGRIDDTESGGVRIRRIGPRS